MNSKELFSLAVAIIESVNGVDLSNSNIFYFSNIISNFSSKKVNFQNLSKKEISKNQNKVFEALPKTKNFNVKSHNRTADEIREL